MQLFRRILLLVTIQIVIYSQLIFSQGGNNNAFVFNGSTSQIYINDGSFPQGAANSDANQSGFNFFNSNSTSNKITIQAWIYLIGDNPDVKMPIVYRKHNSGNSFSLYVKNNKAYFSVGNSPEVSTAEFPAFKWISLTGTFDGSTLKIYNGGNLNQSISYNLNTNYSNGEGLFIGKSTDGAFKGLIDEIRIFDIALSENNINNSGGNGNPAEPFPSSLNQYLRAQWSFTSINNGLLNDLSIYKNHLRVNNITEIYPSKNLPFFVINSTGDEADSSVGNGSAKTYLGTVTLRSAIEETNALTGKQVVYFYITGNSPFIISPTSPLPAITDSLTLDATFQKGYSNSPLIFIDGTNSGVTDGLVITGGNSLVQGLAIKNFNQSGIAIDNNGNNKIQNNIITNNGMNGITIKSGNNNSLLNNSIYANQNIGIDLWTLERSGGVSLNDPLDSDEGANRLQNFPVLVDFYSGSSGTSIKGYLESQPNKTFKLQFFSNSPTGLIDPRMGEIFLGEKTVTTNASGRADF
ncbi:MAG: LamG domain-containing protein, partial [Ignavibacterium sp.]